MNVLSDALKRLLENGDATKQSDFSVQQRKALEALAASTRLIEVVKEGRATFFRIRSRDGLLNYLQQLHPLLDSGFAEDVPMRSRNIGIHRSSKKGESAHAAYYLLMKAWADDVAWHSEEDTLQLAKVTRQFGAAVLQIRAGQSWLCSGPLLLVENQALFDRCDWLSADFDGCLLYYAGQLSELLLRWFSERPRSSKITLFPDYDGIGLSNYARLAAAVHSDTALHFYWMPDWQSKMEKYGDSEIWAKTRVLFENAYNSLEMMGLLDDNFKSLGELVQHYGKALEQEAVWLP